MAKRKSLAKPSTKSPAPASGEITREQIIDELYEVFRGGSELMEGEFTIIDFMNQKGIKRTVAQKILADAESKGWVESRWCIDVDGHRRKAYRKK